MLEVPPSVVDIRVACRPQHRRIKRAHVLAGGLDGWIADSRVARADHLCAILGGPLNALQQVLVGRATARKLADAHWHHAQLPAHSAYANRVVACGCSASCDVRAVAIDVGHVATASLRQVGHAVEAGHAVRQVLVRHDSRVSDGKHNLGGTVPTPEVPCARRFHHGMVPLRNEQRVVGHRDRVHQPVRARVLEEARRKKVCSHRILCGARPEGPICDDQHELVSSCVPPVGIAPKSAQGLVTLSGRELGSRAHDELSRELPLARDLLERLAIPPRTPRRSDTLHAEAQGDSRRRKCQCRCACARTPRTADR